MKATLSLVIFAFNFNLTTGFIYEYFSQKKYCTSGGTRTPNIVFLKHAPLPIGLLRYFVEKVGLEPTRLFKTSVLQTNTLPVTFYFSFILL